MHLEKNYRKRKQCMVVQWSSWSWGQQRVRRWGAAETWHSHLLEQPQKRHPLEHPQLRTKSCLQPHGKIIKFTSLVSWVQVGLDWLHLTMIIGNEDQNAVWKKGRWQHFSSMSRLVPPAEGACVIQMCSAQRSFTPLCLVRDFITNSPVVQKN